MLKKASELEMREKKRKKETLALLSLSVCDASLFRKVQFNMVSFYLDLEEAKRMLFQM